MFDKVLHFSELEEDKYYSSYNKYTYVKINGCLYNKSKEKFSSLKKDFVNRMWFKETSPLKRCMKCGDSVRNHRISGYKCRLCGYVYYSEERQGFNIT